MSKKVIKLDVPVEFDFVLLAVISSLKDYRLCFELNKKMKLKFIRQSDLELKDARHNRCEYTFFRCRNSKTHEEIILILNKGSNGVLIPEMKNVDYFMLIKNQPFDAIEKIVKAMNEIDNIGGVYELDPSELKSAENFLMFEYHEKPKARTKPH
ncbi:MAG: IPExxxVDY family protein [Bacteroidia bacterium]|nr:IPExxxVDY family protein [Bacteroidia bacterium]